MDPPVRGAFRDGLGEFTTEDTLNGAPIEVRFRWSDTDTPTPVWDQAFSPDGGRTWETNWVMKFARPPR